jgi:hypothetical protein
MGEIRYKRLYLVSAIEILDTIIERCKIKMHQKKS